MLVYRFQACDSEPAKMSKSQPAGSLDLLADSREQANAVASYIDALKDFWLAHADLEAALGARTGAGNTQRAGTPATDTHKEHAE